MTNCDLASQRQARRNDQREQQRKAAPKGERQCVKQT